MTARSHERPPGPLHRALAALDSPAAALLTARMLGWSFALPVLKVVLPLKTLVRIMARKSSARPRDASVERRIGRLARLAHRGAALGQRDNCLERSLLAYRYLTAANADPVLVVGARAGARSVEGHVWVLVDGQPVHDAIDEIGTYAPVTVFRADGHVAPTPGAPAP